MLGAARPWNLVRSSDLASGLPFVGTSGEANGEEKMEAVETVQLPYAFVGQLCLIRIPALLLSLSFFAPM